jgi:hypothetical protein
MIRRQAQAVFSNSRREGSVLRGLCNAVQCNPDIQYTGRQRGHSVGLAPPASRQRVAVAHCRAFTLALLGHHSLKQTSSACVADLE